MLLGGLFMNDIKIEKFTISRDDSIMEGWPDLIKLTTGRLIVAYNECTAHANRDHTHIAIRHSDDNGESWSEKQYVGEETFHGDHWNSIRFTGLSSGRIMLVCDRVVEIEMSSKCELYLWESIDCGESFGEGRRLGVHGFCSDKVRELSDGTLLLCVSRYNASIRTNEVAAFKSDDGGRTWREACVVASSDKYNFIEPAALELKDGRVAVFLRENSFSELGGFVTISKDKGESFGEISEMPTPWLQRPVVGYLRDGRILLTYREFLNREMRKLNGCIFDESALERCEGFEIFEIDRDGAEAADSGYSAWVELEKGRLLMANYIVDDAPRAYIRGYRIEIGEN